MCTFVSSVFLSIIVSSFIHIVACISSSLLLMMEQYPAVWIYPILFIHLSLSGHLGCIHLLVIANNAAVNICVTVVVWMPVFKSLGYMSRNVVIWLYGNPSSTLWGNVKLFSNRSIEVSWMKKRNSRWEAGMRALRPSTSCTGLCHLQAVWSGSNYLSSLGHLFILKVGKINVFSVSRRTCFFLKFLAQSKPPS